MWTIIFFIFWLTQWLDSWFFWISSQKKISLHQYVVRSECVCQWTLNQVTLLISEVSCSNSFTWMICYQKKLFTKTLLNESWSVYGEKVILLSWKAHKTCASRFLSKVFHHWSIYSSNCALLRRLIEMRPVLWELCDEKQQSSLWKKTWAIS